MHAWIEHPERNSSTILRGEIWASETCSCHDVHNELVDDGDALHTTLQSRCIRRLLPRRTRLDRGMLQECAIYTCAPNHGIVVYTTLRPSDPADERPNPNFFSQATSDDLCAEAADVPYYHPAVRGVAYHYIPARNSENLSENASVTSQGTIRIDFALFPSEPHPISPSSRLGRTALSLLRMMHQHAYGHATLYVKRVIHDMLVPRDSYQDLYVTLRSKYAHTLIDTWAEVTDPRKHVFEDLGIAAWLILLWRDMFPARDPASEPQHQLRCADVWGQPPGGFVDIGCGNGLLVHILTCEGYMGSGWDARARKSWHNYKQQGTVLLEARLELPHSEQLPATPWIPAGAFLIGNHADELTPWIPFLAASTPACSGFVNIPCCAWTLEGSPFTPTNQTLSENDIASWFRVPPASLPKPSMPTAPVKASSSSYSWMDRLAHSRWFIERTIMPSDCHNTSHKTSHSKHLAYYVYLVALHLQAGWLFESEALRIPSTKNWAMVGRYRMSEGDRGSGTRCCTEAYSSSLGTC